MLLVLGTVGIGRALRGVALDDPYVTYRYAENILSSLGPVYNPGERVLSTTAFGYALLLALLGALLPWLAMPAISNALSAAGLGLLALALYHLGARNERPEAGMAAAALTLLSPLLGSTFGLETCLFLGLVGWTALELARGRGRVAALLGASATALRADGVLAFAVLLTCSALLAPPRALAWQTARGRVGALLARHGDVLAAGGIYVALVVPYQLLLAVLFGSPIPTTLAAKQAQATIAGWPDYLGGLQALLSGWAAESPLYWVAAPLLVVGAGALRRERWAVGLVAWGLFQAAAYQLLGVASYTWYYAPLMPAAAILVGVGASRLTRALGWPSLVALLFVTPIALAELQGLRALRAGVPEPRALAYQRVGEWLAANTPADARVAVMEVGIMGYYARRPMVDLLGLIRPETIEALRRQDFFWTIADGEADVVVLTGKNPLWFQFAQPEHWFHLFYAPAVRIPQEGFWGSPMTIYRRIAPRRVAPAVDGPGSGRFGEHVLLERVVVERTTARPGDFVTVQLFWRARSAPPRDLAAFVHVVTAEPRVVAQHDTVLAATRWPLDRTVQYYHPMRLPEALPPGRYAIEVGVYDPSRPAEADRLPPLDQPHARNIAAIAELTIAP